MSPSPPLAATAAPVAMRFQQLGACCVTAQRYLEQAEMASTLHFSAVEESCTAS